MIVWVLGGVFFGERREKRKEKSRETILIRSCAGNGHSRPPTATFDRQQQ